MSYAFPPDLKSLVDKHFSLGKYTSEEDVLREAMRALEDREAIWQDVALGIADLEAGRGKPLEEVDARLRAKFNIPRTT